MKPCILNKVPLNKNTKNKVINWWVEKNGMTRALLGNEFLYPPEQWLSVCLFTVHHHGTSLPAVTRTNWIPCEICSKSCGGKQSVEAGKEAHVFKEVPRKCFQAERMAKSENSAVEMCFTCRRGSGLVAGVAGSWDPRQRREIKKMRKGSRGHTMEGFGAVAGSDAFWAAWDSSGEFWRRRKMILVTLLFDYTGSSLQHLGVASLVAARG